MNPSSACSAPVDLAGRLSLVAAESTADPNALRVMTFNLRYASARPPNSWPERRPVMRRMHRTVLACLIGTQEGLYSHLKDLETVSAYAMIGPRARKAAARASFMMIFYRATGFEPA